MGRRTAFDQSGRTFRPRQPAQRSSRAMARAVRFSLLVLLTVLAACSGRGAPSQLSGLWSAGPAACAAGVGVQFGPDAIRAVYENESEVLFANPRYALRSDGQTFRVRIIYDLPRVAGAAHVVGSRGVLVLARQRDGGIAPVRHTLIDGRTGAARLRMVGDPAIDLMTLQPCGAHPWATPIRGRYRS